MNKIFITIGFLLVFTNMFSQNIGIGTPTPNHKLHINGGDLFVESSTGKVILGYEGGNQWHLLTTNSGADLRWSTTIDGGTNIINRHYFSQNGNVGIGGFSGSEIPQARLQVIGSGSTSSTNNLMLMKSTGDTILRIRDDGRMGIGYNGSSYGRSLNIGGSGINFYTGEASGFGGAIFPTDTSLVIWSNSGTDNYVILEPTWGYVGIGTYSPDAKFDVNGTMKFGPQGTVINNFIKLTVNKDIPSIAANSSSVQTFTVTNASTGGSVAISPASSLPNGLIIAYARVSAANTVEARFSNITAIAIDPAAMDFFITVIE